MGERRCERIHRNYMRLRKKIKHCGCGGVVGMNANLASRLGRFYIECDSCHWCGAHMPTVRMAIWAWNKTCRGLAWCKDCRYYNPECFADGFGWCEKRIGTCKIRQLVLRRRRAEGINMTL